MATDEQNIVEAFARVYVDDLDRAVSLYQSLVGEEGFRFDFRGLRLAKVGVFLLIEGATDEIRSHTATVSVRDIEAVLQVVQEQGGTAIDGPAQGPNGVRLIADHGDGNIVEYIERPG